MLQPQPTSTPTPAEPFGGDNMSVHWHIVHLHRNKLNLTNSLLQDIAVFSDYDLTKLEEWLTDIETAADLTNESQVKLRQSKTKRTNLYIGHGSNYLWKVLGRNQGFT